MMVSMSSFTAGCIISGQGLVRANYRLGSSRSRCSVDPETSRVIMSLGPPVQRHGLTEIFFRNSGSESRLCRFGKVGRSGRLKFSVNAGAEELGFGSGGGDVGGRGGGGDSGDDLSGNSGDDSSQPIGSALWIWYNSMLENHPLIAKSLTSALLNAIADYFCQVLVEKLPKVDWKRFWSFVAIGLFLSGPALHYWYGALPKIITVPGLKGVLLRIGLDQIIFTPLGMLSFFVVLLTLENRQDEIQKKLEKDLLPTVLANWKVWIPFQVVNFSMVPPQLQVPAAGLLGMLWSVFISYKGHT